MNTILIVDDEKNYLFVLRAVFEEEKYEVLSASSGEEALSILKGQDVDVVLTDIKMPGMDGMELMERIKKNNADLPVIIMTAHGTVEKGEEAVRRGAHSYIFKPFQNEQLLLSVRIAFNMYKVVKENARLRSELEKQYSFGGIIGKSPLMNEVFKTIEKVAPTNATVLIEGESGTGKELVARSIHYNSLRRNEAFIAVNCSALSENLLESELFGHEKGAFTGAVFSRKGRFEFADSGTLFLDEIGEIPLNIQVKLLRVLQEKTFERVGSTKSITVDVRIIAATNKNLVHEMKAGNFREDLFYRLNVVHLTLPSLRDRPTDIAMLVAHFLKKYGNVRVNRSQVNNIDQDVMRLFYDYRWPGNVRELENVIESAMILCPGNSISMADLPRQIKEETRQAFDIESIPLTSKLIDTLQTIEKKMIERALLLSDKVQSRAADMLGIKKNLLHYKIKSYNIKI